MNADPPLVDRLAALPTLASVPREQLEWLAAHGEIRRYAAGELMFRKGPPIEELQIILAGRYSIRMSRAGVSRRVRQWQTGDVSGYLPYSRMTVAPGDVCADEPVELLAIPRSALPEMIRACPEFTALCVHEMVDRARLFQQHDLQFEKMASLGRLSAGIAHELNNPSSAVARTAKELANYRAELAASARALGAASLRADEMQAVKALEDAPISGGHTERPLERSDREDALADWLEAHGLDADLAGTLADAGLSVEPVDRASATIRPEHMETVLRYIASNHLARRLTAEIEMAAARIHTLVGAMKNYTHRDQAQVPEPVALEENLADTLTLLRSEAKKKGVTLELEIEPGLPDVLGVRGELNQVWLNLVDNAIDAAPSAGRVVVSARRERDTVVVSVVDNGGGIAPADRERLFEPFFTTKPVGQGTGLGLDIALGIVHRHGGTIEVNSKPGRTEFRVALPLATTAAGS
jgi:signal transduction histidine kinase